MLYDNSVAIQRPYSLSLLFFIKPSLTLSLYYPNVSEVGLETGLNSSIWKTALKELKVFPATQNYMNHALLCDPFIFITWLYLNYIRQSDRYYSICWSSAFKIFHLLKITFHNNNKLRLLSVLVQDFLIANILGKIRKMNRANFWPWHLQWLSTTAAISFPQCSYLHSRKKHNQKYVLSAALSK